MARAFFLTSIYQEPAAATNRCASNVIIASTWTSYLGAPNGMVMVDQKGKVVLVNAQIEKSFGYGREESIGQPLDKLVRQRFRAKHSAYRNGLIADDSARPMEPGEISLDFERFLEATRLLGL